MSIAIQNILSEHSLNLSRLLEYLKLSGWELDEHPNPNIFLCSYSINEQIVKFVIPKDEQIIDYNERIADAINIISSVENREESAVIKSILKLNKDIFNVRLWKGSSIDSISYNDALKIMSSIKKLMQYSASSEQDPRGYFAKPLARGNSFIKNCQLGHTFHGSFGFTIECPEYPINNFLSEFSNDLSTPLTRKIIIRIIKGLNDVKTGSMDKETIFKNVTDGLNANMCEALLEIVDDLKIDVEYSVDWSKNYNISEDSIYKYPVSLGRNDVELLNFIKEQLMPHDHEQVLIIGKVIELKADAIYETKSEKSPHTIKIETLHNNKPIKISLDLNAKDYVKAGNAHFGEKLIEVQGQLQTIGFSYSLDNPRSFKQSTEHSMKTVEITDEIQIKEPQKGLSDWF
ncbi:hypothetical protein [Methanococcoides seepicolus]|uniref:Uncharacterized protein n=1 Tax=Methanococcoides seepicolus TaxID=2828780 RepID=A0A9E4ZES0_9EURY|nr:hypothetical protein [Methanococcoides seepicolus]MCM1985594.1 hypothetical protein [Methanococcoides seepicolus]